MATRLLMYVTFMNNKQFVIEQAKQKLEEILEPIRTKVNLIHWAGLAGLTVFCFIFAWAARFRFPFAYIPVIFLLVGIFRSKSELRKTFRQDYYEDELKYLEKEPETADDYYSRGHTLNNLEFHEAAVEDYRKAIEMEPNDQYFLIAIITTLWGELERGEEALPYVEQLTQMENDNDYKADAFMYRGRILAKTDPEAALKSFDKAIEIDPDDSDYPLAKMRFLIDAGRLDAATDYLPEVEKAVKEERAYGQWPINEIRSRLALKQGNPADAVAFASKALRHVPRSDLYLLRAEAYDALGQIDKADADRRKAEKLESKQ